MTYNLNEDSKAWFLIFSCWVISAVAMAGSLFFSEVMEFPPCSLCWYQRIAMYPLVLIFFVGLISPDKGVIKYSLPLTITGWIISVYHNLLSLKIIPESAAPCREGVSCATVYLDWFGFITIPLLSLIAFSLLLILARLFCRKHCS